jgi:hypothetical protein
MLLILAAMQVKYLLTEQQPHRQCDAAAAGQEALGKEAAAAAVDQLVR